MAGFVGEEGSTTPLLSRNRAGRPSLPLMAASYQPSPPDQRRLAGLAFGDAQEDPHKAPPAPEVWRDPSEDNDVEAGTLRHLTERLLAAHPDRGTGVYHQERQRHLRPSLVETGRHSGKSRVVYRGLNALNLRFFIWRRDFYTSVTTLRFRWMLASFGLTYMLSFILFAGLWGLLAWLSPLCVDGIDSSRYGGFLSMVLFSIETQQTIGYGVRAPMECWTSVGLLAVQCIWATFLNAVWVGILFARISHPKYRGRTIFLSDSAVICRRDGVLKFMFRIADIRQTHVVSPKVDAFLFTWGSGRKTAEGEVIPACVSRLDLGVWERGMTLLLPAILEHTIDEASPLYGQTADSLEALAAEVVVSFTGVSELGQQFSERTSYLWSEIHWGFIFSRVVFPPAPGHTRHVVDLSRFHEVEPQEGLDMMPAGLLSRKVVTRPNAALPFPSLSENTLVLSSCLALAPRHGALCLLARVGDTYTNNMIAVRMRMYLYRWGERVESDGEDPSYEEHELKLEGGGGTGEVPLLLRLPKVVSHKLEAGSPLWDWRHGPLAFAKDADSEIVVVVEAVHYSTSRAVLQQRSYSVSSDVKWGCRFAPVVSRPQAVRAGGDGKPHVSWDRFHTLVPVNTGEIEGAIQGAESGARSRTTSQLSEAYE